jgi:precorrin-2 dehydrogenase/sirohydrochlorin ferrochelatase
MLRKRHMVACTDDLKVNKRIYDLCRKRYLICNIADTPPCDYYLGGIVTKGNVKLRFRQTENHQLQPSDCEFFEEVIPEDINKWLKI